MCIFVSEEFTWWTMHFTLQDWNLTWNSVCRELGNLRKQKILRREEICAPRYFSDFWNIELTASLVLLCMSGVSDEYDWSLACSVFLLVSVVPALHMCGCLICGVELIDSYINSGSTYLSLYFLWCGMLMELSHLFLPRLSPCPHRCLRCWLSFSCGTTVLCHCWRR